MLKICMLELYQLSAATHFMLRGRNILEMKQLMLLNNSLASLHLSYCCLIWAINYPTSLISLVSLQKKKRACRAILALPYC